ncbi:hypothetical protein CVP05_04625 [Conservatibacter flavescens]|uniref:Uncharacterized protein n=2 Tax=Conservatibacter flavescens TaxID=28161 RepID=A0A2M8S3L5_9PAST|nr:hypothetical protein CVP05_04625 [Conservatibacter flavescens]
MIGFGSILNVSPVVFLSTNVGTPSDDKANLQKDWQAVGGYLYKAMETLENERATFSRKS